ncbi:probable anion transporter 6, chloroplastic isoform X2 [Salvia hispanica]|uniref:probable anion transporter 6, chloroplastic isoform X2 n=1 Tax=Salvia hispanica TaxID=49212 RepID=UPI0020097B4F|nr:probable anion transporter 6, chloroplastic isoform X2 [Salvia hispanica]
MAARIISNVDSNFLSFSYGTSIKTPIPRTQPLIGFPFKKRLNFEALCSIKEREREREIAAEKQGLASGVVVDDELKRKEGVGGEGFDLNWPPWKNLPQRYKLIGTTSLAFVICNMDKVNLSIAIIPMSHQFGWNASVAGLVQSSFFWGYALSQLPGGWLSKIFGGRRVLEVGVLVWSLATAMVPLLAGFMPGLVLSRVLVGIGEGVSPSAATDMIARTVPIEERSRAVSFVFGGLSFGSVLGLVLAPPLIENYGWGSVFYIFGSLGIAWYLIFQVIKEDNLPFAASHQSWPQTVPMTKSWTSTLQDLGGSLTDVPWKEFFKSKAVWAMIYTHFCGSWGHYCCLSWLPTYFSEELDLDLTEAAWVSVLPPLASIFVTSIASQLADYWISNGVETTVVRKVCQTIAFLSPATCMILSSLDLGLSPWQVVAILTSGLALSSFALSGLYCTHQDISPEYASVLLGITNTVGAVPGIVGVALTGYLLDTTHSWGMSLFAPSIFFYLTGTVVWLALASSKPQSFSKSD